MILHSRCVLLYLHLSCMAMNSGKPNFLAQPVVKNVFVYRNGDPYYDARRVVINEKRVTNFETFLREVTGGIQPPFGAVRNIYTPKGGHRVASLDHLQNGEQYVAAGREKFKKLDYVQIGTRKKRLLQANGLVKPVPQSRIIVSARFLKPIKEPCAIFVVANGDVLTPAVRLLVPNRMLGQFERILEMITEKMGLRILGGVRSIYTFDGAPVTDGKELENGQFYVAVGREKFKKLPYSDLLFTKPMGMRRVFGSKAASLPPIYRFRRQNCDVGNHLSKSLVSTSEPDETKTSSTSRGAKDQIASIVREISQARLMTLRRRKSGVSMSLAAQDKDNGEQSTAEDNCETEEKPLEQEGSAAEQKDETDTSKNGEVDKTAEGEVQQDNPTTTNGEESEKGEDEENKEEEKKEDAEKGEGEEVEEEGSKVELTEEKNEKKENEEQPEEGQEEGKEDTKEEKDGKEERENDEEVAESDQAKNEEDNKTEENATVEKDRKEETDNDEEVTESGQANDKVDTETPENVDDEKDGEDLRDNDESNQAKDKVKSNEEKERKEISSAQESSVGKDESKNPD